MSYLRFRVKEDIAKRRNDIEHEENVEVAEADGG